jgi:hypothetical protein
VLNSQKLDTLNYLQPLLNHCLHATHPVINCNFRKITIKASNTNAKVLQSTTEPVNAHLKGTTQFQDCLQCSYFT